MNKKVEDKSISTRKMRTTKLSLKFTREFSKRLYSSKFTNLIKFKV